LETISWGEIKVGNILKLNKDEVVPADIILLDSNEIKDREAQCLIDTHLVDGLSHL